jgi:hypothetical protein
MLFLAERQGAAALMTLTVMPGLESGIKAGAWHLDSHGDPATPGTAMTGNKKAHHRKILQISACAKSQIHTAPPPCNGTFAKNQSYQNASREAFW